MPSQPIRRDRSDNRSQNISINCSAPFSRATDSQSGRFLEGFSKAIPDHCQSLFCGAHSRYYKFDVGVGCRPSLTFRLVKDLIDLYTLDRRACSPGTHFETVECVSRLVDLSVSLALKSRNVPGKLSCVYKSYLPRYWVLPTIHCCKS